MCGRFTLRVPLDILAQHFDSQLTDESEYAQRFNIAPSQQVATVRLQNGLRELTIMRWGLIPSWAKDIKIGFSSINARADTVATKPAFRSAYKRRRCLVLGDGYYEWKTEG